VNQLRSYRKGIAATLPQILRSWLQAEMLQRFIDWSWKVNDRFAEFIHYLNRQRILMGTTTLLLLAAMLAATLVVLIHNIPKGQTTYHYRDSGDSVTMTIGDIFKVSLSYGARDMLGLTLWTIISPVNPRIPDKDAVLRLSDVKTDCKNDFQGLPYDCSSITYTFEVIGAGETVLELRSLSSHFLLNIKVE
jgi:hypothetical protein